MNRYLLTALLLWGTCSLPAQHIHTLQSCLETGLERNYSVRIVRNEQRITDNDVTLANAGYLPTVELTAGYGGDLTSARTNARAGERLSENGTLNHSANLGAELNWTLFDGFRVQTNYARLKELQQMGELATRITLEDFMASLIAEYYNFIQQEIRLKNFRYAVSLSKERLRIVEARYQIGNFSRLDLQQARVDFNAASSRYMTQQELVIASRIRQIELMANPNVNEKFRAGDSVIRVIDRLEWHTLEEGMLRTNASLLMAERDKTLAELDLKTIRARNYPYMNLNAGYAYSWNRYGSGANRTRQNFGPSAGIRLGFTLFDGNRRREQQNARIRIENADLERMQLEQSLRADLANFWQAYLNNKEVLYLEKENLAAAKENHEIAMERYLLGDLSGIEMREAQKSLLDAEERILTAQYNTKLCEISLQQISGNILSYLER